MNKQQLDIIGALARQGLTLKGNSKGDRNIIEHTQHAEKNSPTLDAVLKDNALLSDALVEGITVSTGTRL